MTSTPPRPAPELADIAAARRRSALYGIDPAASQIPYFGEPRPAGDAMRQLSKPVLDELLWQIDTSPLAVVLADREGRITRREAPDASTLTTMDEKNVDVGFSLSETDVGTNGVGTSLETRRPTVVVGEDHYLETFQDFTCVNAPIVHPITRRVEGTVGVLCPVGDTSPLLLPTAVHLAEEITRLLLDQATPEERFLLQKFLSRRRQSNDAVATLGAGVMIATPAAQRLLADIDHRDLWTRIDSASQHNSAGTVEIDFERPIGGVLRLSCEPLYRGGDLGGATVEFVDRPKPTRSRSVERSQKLGELVGVSSKWRDVVKDGVQASQVDEPLVIVGERGTGRLSVAKAVAGLHRMRRYQVFDCAALVVDGPQSFLRHVAHTLSLATTTIIRRIELLPDDVAAALASLIAAAGGDGRVIATAGDAMSDSMGHAALFDQLHVLRIDVPPLRERRSDIAPLTSHLSAQLGYQTLESQLFTILYRQLWPGNVTELRQTLRAAHSRASGTTMRVEHLPSHIRLTDSRTPLHGLRQQEAQAIIAALNATTTRTEAAEQLGISRATLYRRIESYGLDIADH